MAELMPMSVPSDNPTSEKIPTKKLSLNNKNNFSKRSLKEFSSMNEREKLAESLTLWNNEKTGNIVKGVGLSEGELKALHARQNHEIKMMKEDINSIVIPPTREGEASKTLGQLLALHNQQKYEIEKADYLNEIVIPASEDGSPGLSRNELKLLHEQQEKELENNINWNEIVIPANEGGLPELSGEKISTLHDQQHYEIWEEIDNPYEPVAPPLEDGGPNLTVFEIKELHKRQTFN